MQHVTIMSGIKSSFDSGILCNNIMMINIRKHRTLSKIKVIKSDVKNVTLDFFQSGSSRAEPKLGHIKFDLTTASSSLPEDQQFSNITGKC